MSTVYELFIDSLVDIVAERVQKRLAAEVTVPRLLSLEQAAVYLGRSERAVRQMSIPAVKLDGRVQFDRRDLDIFIENSKVVT